MGNQDKKPAVESAKKYKMILRLLVIGVVALNLFLYLSAVKKQSGEKALEATNGADGALSNKEMLKGYVGSHKCAECHTEAYEKWRYSHHALAERQIIPAIDKAAFDPPRKFKHGKQESEARIRDGNYEIVTLGKDGKVRPYKAERVIGVSPLRQFLIKEEAGRYQVTEVAVDSTRNEWFNVYGDEDRQPGEWGHWTGRGMNWNSMCAICHNTRLIKNYDESMDSYRTVMAEMGVGCEACHDKMGGHYAWQKKNPNKKGDPTIVKYDVKQWLSICGSCHSRRGDLTGEFKPGDNFFDHYSLTIPDETDIFYPDGQVRDEDFEFTAFSGSRMSKAGVKCMDCHDPHSGKTILKGNALCLRCHSAPIPPAPKVDPATHSFHKPGTSGDLCTDCHMPQTAYMQRHLRHDHGYTIPDPLLTIRFNIPNACNRCHKDKTAEWSLEYVEKWYGKKMERWSRNRAITIALAREGKSQSIDGLLEILKKEEIPLWRAVAVNLMKRWVYKPEVLRAVIDASEDKEPIVRAMSARALEPYADTSNQLITGALRRLLEDPVKNVRIESAWALRRELQTNTVQYRELIDFIRYNSDQPSGLLQLGVFYMDRGDPIKATEILKKAVSWETNSAPLHSALAVCYSVIGRSDEAVRELEIACQLAPKDAEYRFRLALAYNEVGLFDKTLQSLEEAVKLDPEHDNAWYNLGLLYNRSGDTEKALSALNRAEVINGYSARIPYARATILYRLGKLEEARKAAKRALDIDPDFIEAVELLKILQQ